MNPQRKSQATALLVFTAFLVFNATNAFAQETAGQAAISDTATSQITEPESAVKDANSTSYMVLVPSTGSFISDKMMIAALKSGSESASVRQVRELLSLPTESPLTIRVDSKSDSIAVATLERALREMKTPASVPHNVIIQAKPKQLIELQALGKAKGVVVTGL
jgi:hypothetical protein